MTKDITSDHLLEYVRGNLSPDMREKVDLGCEADKKLAQELAYYKGLTTALSKDRPNSSELQWQKLSRAIDDISAPLQPHIPANDTGRVWRWAACALGVLLVGQTALTTLGSRQAETKDPIYVTVTQTELENSLQVSFVPVATEVDIRTLLLSVDAEIVSGPSALGIYTLSFDSKENQETALIRLSEKLDIVEMVTEN